MPAKKLCPEPELLKMLAENECTVDECASHFGVSRPTVIRWFHEHGIPSVPWKRGKRRYIPVNSPHDCDDPDPNKPPPFRDQQCRCGSTNSGKADGP